MENYTGVIVIVLNYGEISFTVSIVDQLGMRQQQFIKHGVMFWENTAFGKASVLHKIGG
jgi:hypothetical protein